MDQLLVPLAGRFRSRESGVRLLLRLADRVVRLAVMDHLSRFMIIVVGQPAWRERLAIGTD